MKLGVMIPESIYAAWSLTGGLANTLVGLGHEVTAIFVPQTGQVVGGDLPGLDELAGYDALVISGPEHIAPYLRVLYGETAWKGLKTPKVGWYHESDVRDDRQYGFATLQWVCDAHYYPAVQDAEQFKGSWLPFGVDTELFYTNSQAKLWETAFIGLVYPKRAEFLAKLRNVIRTPLQIGQCYVHTLAGFDLEASTELYANELRRTRIFLNLPSLSRLAVTKHWEAAACGALVLSPTPQGDERNWKDVPAIFYDPDNLGALADTLEHWLKSPEELEQTALAFAMKAMEYDSLTRRCQTLTELL